MKIARSEKKLVAVCALALFIPLGVAAFVGHINATPTIAATSPAKAPTPNGYDLYVRASNLIKPANPPVDAILELKTVTDPKIRAQRYSLARKDAWLRQNKAGFALFDRAQKMDSLAPPIYQSGVKSPQSLIRQMARYKTVESNAHWQRGNYHAALQSGLDVLQLGHDIRCGGGRLDFLIGCDIAFRSHRSTGDTIEYLSAKQAKTASRRVEKLLRARWTLKQALIQDRDRSRQDWLKAFENPQWRTEELFYRRAFGGPLNWSEQWNVRTISKRQIFADLDVIYRDVIAVASAPYGIQQAKSVTSYNPFVYEHYYFLPQMRFNQARAQTSDRVLMLRLALRAYQLEHGAPPPNLQMLVPNYIKAVPVDPFGKGEPLRYKTNGVNYTLWSIGPDGRDDGGKPIPWFKKSPKRYADEREKLPFVSPDYTGDYVAGKNH